MPARPEPESSRATGENRQSGVNSGSEPQSQSQMETPSHRPEMPGVWLPFGLFVLGFAILAAESKFTLPPVADYALKGLGGALCLLTVVWIRRQARKLGIARRPSRTEQK